MSCSQYEVLFFSSFNCNEYNNASVGEARNQFEKTIDIVAADGDIGQGLWLQCSRYRYTFLDSPLPLHLELILGLVDHIRVDEYTVSRKPTGRINHASVDKSKK